MQSAQLINRPQTALQKNCMNAVSKIVKKMQAIYHLNLPYQLDNKNAKNLILNQSYFIIEQRMNNPNTCLLTIINKHLRVAKMDQCCQKLAGRANSSAFEQKLLHFREDRYYHLKHC